MLRKLACLGFSLFVLPQSALATPVGLFDGPMKILTATSSCHWATGRIYTAMYMPPNVGTNGAGSRLTVLGVRDEQDGQMTEYELATGSFVTSGGSSVTVDQTNVWVGVGRSNTAQITISQQIPKVPTNTTSMIRLAGTIVGFRGDTACTATFDATVLSYQVP